MNKVFFFFFYSIFYTEIILYIHVTNKIFIQKLENKKIRLKLAKIKKLNNYLHNQIEISKNKKLKKMLHSNV